MSSSLLRGVRWGEGTDLRQYGVMGSCSGFFSAASGSELGAVVVLLSVRAVVGGEHWFRYQFWVSAVV